MQVHYGCDGNRALDRPHPLGPRTVHLGQSPLFYGRYGIKTHWDIELRFESNPFCIQYVLHIMCVRFIGEYQDMARLNRLNNSERAGVVVDLLRNVVGYGQRTFTGDSDSDSDFSMSDIDGALVFDENGGEILVSAAMVDALSEELGEDIDFDEFSSDDDDE